MNELILTSFDGKLTLAMIDGFDDRWHYAIVTDYNGPQEFGQVIVSFGNEVPADQTTCQTMLDAVATGRKLGGN